MNRPFNAFERAQSRFDEGAAGFLGLDSQTRELLRWPPREDAFAIRVRMDDGRVEVFRGFRVPHSDERGPSMGGGRDRRPGADVMTPSRHMLFMLALTRRDAAHVIAVDPAAKACRPRMGLKA